LKHFGSLDKIKEASLEELTAVKGMNLKAAEAIKAHLE
jgi:excinuclease UvrABC nuclease subunit